MAAALEVPPLDLAELRRLVSDVTELDKGVRVVDAGGLAHLARHAGRLFAEAAGAGPAPYRVSVGFDDKGGAAARCTCMAARSRPFCKHAAGLLVAWAQTPGSFAVADGPPPGQAVDGQRRRAVKTGKTDASALMRAGVEQVETLVRELAAAGIASLTGARLGELRTLAGALRESRLRRLSGRALALADLLEPAARRQVVDAGAYADLIADLLLTVRKLERHLDGEPLEPRHVEELIGKTWRRSDREPVSGLDLVEYSFAVWKTADDFSIRESRFFDLRGGGHWSEKQILPAFLARRSAAKPTHAGLVLRGASGSAFPGFAPRRLDLEECEREPLGPAALEALVERSLPDVGAALAAFQEHRRDVFAPDRLAVALRVDTIAAMGGRARAVDAGGSALFLPGSEPGDALIAALRVGRLVALLGDVDLDAALPTLSPLAAVVRGRLGLELFPVGEERAERAASSWLDAARSAGASTAAISLAEVRAELADGLTAGLGMLTARVTDALAARLRQLGLDKPAALLAGLPAQPDPAGRLDDFVKLYQVLGVALVRLCGAAHVDRAALEPVPTLESIAVARRDELFAPREVARRVASGVIGRWDAAVLYARWYEAMPREDLAASIDRIWADGSAAPHVARAFAGRGDEAAAMAEPALARHRGRVARMTGLRAIAAAGGPRAEVLLERAAADEDGALGGLAADLLEALLVARGALTRDAALRRRERLVESTAGAMHVLLGAPRQEQRQRAAAELAAVGARHAIPVLRQALGRDSAAAVRDEAALALAALGDTEQVDRLIADLARRTEPAREPAARTAARALGILGDARGVDQLLAACAEGWKPAIVGEALRAAGMPALEPMLELLETRPELARRKAAADIARALPPGDVVAAMAARLRARPAADLARLYFKLLAGEPRAEARRRLAGELLHLAAQPGAGDPALRKLADDALR
jgi:hypothetical protein